MSNLFSFCSNNFNLQSSTLPACAKTKSVIRQDISLLRDCPNSQILKFGDDLLVR